MSRFVPSRSTAVVVAISTLFLIAISTAGVKGTGQAPAAAKPAQSTAPPTAAQIAPFVGDWLVTVYLQAIEASVVVSVKADGGKPSATISSDTQPTTNVSGMAMAGNRLILRYSVDMGGTPISTVMTLTPDGPGLRAEMAVMDGQYELTGTGTRQTPGAPRRASGFGGGGRGAQTSEATDFSPKPPYTARTAAEEARGFMLPAGYRMELVASDPDIISPSLIEFDGNGRMYVGEMISYMMDAERHPRARPDQPHQPLGEHQGRRPLRQAHRVRRPPRRAAHDPAAAGRRDPHQRDRLRRHREVDATPTATASPTSARSSSPASARAATPTSSTRRRACSGTWTTGSTPPTTRSASAGRRRGFLREPTGPNGGQWGLASDDDGKPWFVDAGGERGPMNFQFPIHYGAFTPCPAAGRGTGGRAGAACRRRRRIRTARRGWRTASRRTSRWCGHHPGIGDMQGGIPRTRMPAQNLNHFTATTGPAIFRGDRLPADLKGDLLFTEPVGRLIRRAAIDNIEGLTQLRNVYPNAEFLTSADQLFRPVNISNAPDGTLYIADMYHGIIQELEWSGPGSYLRAKIEQYQLDKVASHGRIWRLRYDGRAAVAATATNIGQPAIPAIAPDFAPPRMYSEIAGATRRAPDAPRTAGGATWRSGCSS